MSRQGDWLQQEVEASLSVLANRAWNCPEKVYWANKAWRLV